ncbi:hypothetical protein BJX76DRAFT_358756 [Aspergillus varians]
MSSELNERSTLLARPPTRKRSSVSSTSGKLIELRPKGSALFTLDEGSLVVVTAGSPTEFKRKQHAQAQKQQRDRLKAALDRIAQIMEDGGPNAGTGGGATKAELVEAAVDYIQSLQGQLEELRGRHATG